MREGGINKNLGSKGVRAMCRSHGDWAFLANQIKAGFWGKWVPSHWTL